MSNQQKSSTHGMLIGILLILFVGALTYIIYTSNEEKVSSDKPEPVTSDLTEEQIILKDNKEVIDDAIKKTYGQVSDINQEDHFMGELGAPVQFIVYSDFECPYCAQFVDTVNKVKNIFVDDVVISFRHFPLKKHENAMVAAIVSECAAEQGSFWEMHDKLFENNKNNSLKIAQFKKDAESIGLDTAQFNSCVDDEKYKDKVEAQIAEGKTAGVSGTPNIFINGQTLQGAYPLEDFVDTQGNSMKGLRSIIEKHLSS